MLFKVIVPLIYVKCYLIHLKIFRLSEISESEFSTYFAEFISRHQHLKNTVQRASYTIKILDRFRISYIDILNGELRQKILT